MPPGLMDSQHDTAFAAFLAEQRPRVLAFLRRLCGDEAEDVLQETMAKVWRLRGGFDARQNGPAWLMQSALHTLCDQRTRGRRRPVAAGALDDAAPTPPCPIELDDELRHRLAALSPVERELLLGFHRDGRTLAELAAQHGMPLNTVKSHLRRARLRALAAGGAVFAAAAFVFWPSRGTIAPTPSPGRILSSSVAVERPRLRLGAEWRERITLIDTTDCQLEIIHHRSQTR